MHLQTRSAVAVAAFTEFCVDRSLSQPPEKIVKNLCTFLCQDVDQTPTFSSYKKLQEGILSFSKSHSPVLVNGNSGASANPEEAAKARLSRRGAGQAFVELSRKFGPRLLDVIPKMWHSMAGGLLSACTGGKSVTLVPGT